MAQLIEEKSRTALRAYKERAQMTKPIYLGLKAQHAASVTANLRAKLARVPAQFASPKETELNCVFVSLNKANAGHRCTRGIAIGERYRFCAIHSAEVEEMDEQDYVALRDLLDSVRAPKPNLAEEMAKALRRKK